MVAKVLLAVLFLICATTSQLSAQDGKSHQAFSGLVVIDGPYELDGGGGTLGYVLRREGTLVDFQPCLGPILSIEESRLKETKFGCNDEPPVDGHPLNVSCDTVASDVNGLLANGKDDPNSDIVGTAYAAQANASVLKILPGSATNSKIPWEVVDTVGDCGDRFVILTDANTQARWIGFVKNSVMRW
ncbi:hypothetical protein [Rhizobium azibense]|uniref:Uncharacterized protein n=1 Tax=Rhizobium azibense TaxID=1136135 RepID=A0A4V2VF24_9HYPH|nr:hypothetical protein [Rhizobium azibense]TCU38755.1 hypothetical protein EV129_104362 [Rhizobium azibense]